jgi:hypothetical protein
LPAVVVAVIVVSVMADKYFGEKTRENLRRGLHSAVRKRTAWWAPFGSKVERLVLPDGGRPTFQIAIDEETEAPVVREIFALVIGGHSAAAVARQLNARGVPSAKGGRW